jgi:RNA polymerase sigma-70 factor (ECF subfamily)
MEWERDAVVGELDALLAAERPRLVRLCARITGDAREAEDLAQETLLEAWRHRHKLHEPVGYVQWLVAIARNVCRRRARTRTRDLAGLAWAQHEDERVLPVAAEELPASCDVEIELERDELATLLDRALGLLPPETRQVLLQRYVQEYPEAEIAARLGVSTGAVEARLHRGKLALRTVLATDLRQDALAYGLLATTDSGWQPTRIWCPICGRHRLVGHALTQHAAFSLRCPGCFPAYHSEPALNIARATAVEELGGVKTFKPALTRIMTAWDAFFQQARAAGFAPCVRCGHANTPRSRRTALAAGPPTLSARGVAWRCERCAAIGDLHLLSLTLYGPVGRRFWQDHPRIRMLPEREIVAAGRPALLTRFESLTDAASLEVVSAQDTFEVLHSSSTPHA